MKGTMLVLWPHDLRIEVRECDGEPTLAWLKDGIGGGYLEVVPRWNKIAHAGKHHRCVAFCDEDGKRKELAMNRAATLLWDKCMRQAFGVGCAPDYLVGQIAVVFGDDEFMEAL